MPNLYKQTWVVWTARNYSCFKLNTRFWNNSQEEWFCQTCHSGLFCGHHCLSSYHVYAGLSALISSLWTYRRPVCWALNSAVFGDRFWLASVRTYGWRFCIFRHLVKHTIVPLIDWLILYIYMEGWNAGSIVKAQSGLDEVCSSWHS